MRHHLVKNLSSQIQSLMGTSDEKLVEKAQKGNGKAFGQLYLKYLDALYRYIYFRVDRVEEKAEDLTEIVFVKAYEALHRFDRTKGTFKAWLYQIARNTVYDHYRTQKPVSPLEYAFKAEAEERGPEEQAIDNDHIKNIKNAITHLSDEQKEIIELSFIEGFENAEIEEIMDKTSDAVRALKYRALNNLKQAMKDNEHAR